MAMTKIKGLQQWCRRMTDGYPHVDVANFTTAWRDGMAFCAIIHRFRPDLIDYDALSPDNVYENCKLAFEVAEKELDIPAFLEAEDMARLKVPDKLSVITYVSQYYNFLNALPQLGGPGVKGKVTTKPTTKGKRPPDIDTSQAPSSKRAATSEEGKENVSTGVEKQRQGTLGDKCNICQNRVYLLERHMEGGKLYHRSCFRHSELSPTNKVYTRSPFLSPSLSGETPPLSPSHLHTTTASSNSEHQRHHQQRDAVSDSKSGTAAAALKNGHSELNHVKGLTPFSQASSGSPRKPDSIGTKHGLAQSDKGPEDTKKSKLQPTVVNDEERLQKATAIKDRLKNLKEKYEIPKKEDRDISGVKKLEPKEQQSHTGVFPLSGKESRQLEKHREQLVSAEKRAEHSTRGGARNVPLIFQQKTPDSSIQSSSVSSVLSNAKPSTSTSTSSTFHSSIPSSSAIFNTPTSSKTSTALDLGHKPEKKTARKIVKAELVTKKEPSLDEKTLPDKAKSDKTQFVSKNKTVLNVNVNDKPSVASLTKNSSTTEDNDLAKAGSQPVAKTRTHKPSALAKLDSLEATPTPALRASEVNVSPTPKAAPRKSLIEVTSEKKKPPERPKHPPSAGRKSQQETPPLSARSAGSESPPPLPETPPPPLPTSPPSALPATVIKVDASSPRSKVDVNPTDRSKGGRSGESHEVITHSPVKSRVAVNTQAVANTSNKRWSSPAIHDTPLSVFGSPQVKGKQEQNVLSGLLTSLAGIRGRAGSVPGISTTTSLSVTPKPISPPPSASTASTTFQPSPSPSSTARKAISKPGHDKDPKTPVSGYPVAKKTLHKISEDDHKSGTVTGVKASEPQKKLANGPQPVSSTADKVPEAFSVLNSLKKVGDLKPSDTKTSHITTSAGSTKIEINTQGTPSKLGKNNFLTASRENLVQVSTRQTDNKAKQAAAQEKSTDANFNTVKLKPVASGQQQKQKTEQGTAPAFDIQLKKVEKKVEDQSTKPTHLHKPLADTVSTVDNKNASKVEIDNARKNSEKVVEIIKGDPPTQSLVVESQSNESKSHRANFYEEDELPDWKTALEERKKKLRENAAAKSLESPPKDNDASSVDSAQSVAVEDKTKKTNLGDSLAQSSPGRNKDTSKNDPPSSKTKSPRDRSASPHRAKISAKTTQLSIATPAVSVDKKPLVKSPDWKHDAEMKIAALGGFESEEDDKTPQRPKRRLPKVPDATPISESEPKTVHKEKLNSGVAPSSKSEPAMVNKMRVTLDTERKEGAKEEKVDVNKPVVDEVKSKEIPKEPVPEFLTSKSNLKHVEFSEENKHPPKAKQDRVLPPATGEDFREKLHNLKHVQGAGEGEAVGVTCAAELPALTTSPRESKPTTEVSPPSLPVLKQRTQPLPVGDGSRNTNNNKRMNQLDRSDAPSSKPLMDTINLTSSPDVSEEEENRGNNSPHQRHSTPILENGKALHKDKKKKKISFFGKNKKEKPASPTESPIAVKKKIEAPVGIDFDKSSELETSLPDATAQLTIEDKKTPPQRPPPPHHNHVKVTSPKHISAIELQQQLLDIDSRLTDLELRGRDLEDSIRNVNVLEEDDDSLMIKWFELVSEKNDLVRQEADLVYMSREQDLETEQDHIESQLRYLMSKADLDKSAAEMEEEEYLIQRKLELVEQRNRIVDSMDEDRLRYEEEDRDIEVTLRDKGLWKDSNGTLKALKGKRVSNSTFYT